MILFFIITNEIRQAFNIKKMLDNIFDFIMFLIIYGSFYNEKVLLLKHYF